MDWRQRLRSITADRHRFRLVIAWGSLIVVEIFLRASDLAPIPPSSWIFEIVALAVIGIAHAAPFEMIEGPFSFGAPGVARSAMT